MRSRACRTGNSGATECNQRTCGPDCQSNRTVLRPAAGAPEMFQNDKYHNVATALRETNHLNHRTYSQGRITHHPLCKCGNCSRGHLPGTTFKDLLYRQNAGGVLRANSQRSSQSHSHSQQNGGSRHCCGGCPSVYQGKVLADNLNEGLRSTPRSSVFSASGNFEQRKASGSAGSMSHLPLSTKEKELRTSLLDTTSQRCFQCRGEAPPGAVKKQISLHGWYLMKPSTGENTSGCLSIPGVAVGGYRSPLMLRTDFVQTARVEQRLERSKLLTSDGLEVTLMDMIDLDKSIANGFSPALVKYFLIGFPANWIYMMRNIHIRSSMPSSSAQRDMDNLAEQRQEISVEGSPALRTPTETLFTPPNEGTWREALRSFSPTTINSFRTGSTDIDITQECDPDQEQSKGQRNCPKVNLGADSQAEDSGLRRMAPSMTRDCPHSEPEAIAVENTHIVPDGSSQTRTSTLPWVRRPEVQGDLAGGDAGDTGEAGGDPESTFRKKSVVVKDAPDLRPVSPLGEDFHQIRECSSQAHETQVVTDYPNSVVKVRTPCESLPNSTTEESAGVVDVEDSTVFTEDFAVVPGDETELPSVQGPYTPLGAPTELRNKDITENSILGVGIDPAKSLHNLGTGRKLRSGRSLLVVDKDIREQGSDRGKGIESTKTRKRVRKPRTLSSEGDKMGMLSREPVSSAEDLVVHHDDAGVVDVEDSTVYTEDFTGDPGDEAELPPVQGPYTPFRTSTQLMSDASKDIIENSTRVGIDPVKSLHNSNTGRKLRSGRCLLVVHKDIREQGSDHENGIQSTKTRKRVRNPQTLSSEGDEMVMLSREPVSSTEDLVVHHDDARVVDVEDSTVYTEDFTGDPGDETDLPPVQGPYTKLQTSTQLMSDANKDIIEISTRVGTDPVKSPHNFDTGTKLRSRRCRLVVDKDTREQDSVREIGIETTKTRRRVKKPQTLASGVDQIVMRSREPISLVGGLVVRHDDVYELGRLDQGPSTPSQKITKRLRLSPGSNVVVDTPTIEAETHLVSNLQNVDGRKKLRSGRYFRALDKPIQELVVHPVITPESSKTRKRPRISPSAAPVANRENVHSIECDGPPCNAVVEERDNQVDKLHEGDSEVSSRPSDELCKESAGVHSPVIKKRRKVSKLYRSRRKKSCPESFPTHEQKLNCSAEDSCKSRLKNLKVGVDKSFQVEETKPTLRKNRTKAHKFSKTTGREELNRATSRHTSQAENEVQTGKRNTRTRNSVVPPPLPAPRVADESNVIKAYGLKKSRFGRILVPPLAVWCNQSIIYDTDGSIIAISDAPSSEAEFVKDCFNFTLPSDTGARKMQRKLLKAARIDWSRK